MGIPIGKLSLYVAAGGFHPSRTLPITLDTGTNNKTLLDDPLYLGEHFNRVGDDIYYDFVEEFMLAVRDKWPRSLVQFEDFSNEHAFELLARHRDHFLCFNDDIQGTGAIVAAGFMNAIKVAGIAGKDHRLVFLGAGSAGIGVADAIVRALEEEGMSTVEARKRVWLVDSKGLVVKNRGDQLAGHKLNYARDDCEPISTLLEVVQKIKPTALIGLSGNGGQFTEEIIRTMKSNTEKPIIFPLSNPTSKAECTAKQAYEWTDYTCIFASGSPFDIVEHNGKRFIPGQGNNMYVFPGLGFGAYLVQAKGVSEQMIHASAKAVAISTTPEEFADGRIYPKLDRIRAISEYVAIQVAKVAFEQGLAQIPRPESIEDYIHSLMYRPEYLN